ncbi:MAG TPA: nucleoside/nucleotide kinase family protein, partial [Gammaproteobacteria bacterium]|nr:nucleoside/nucleotide kinase family protein [Gammaproteobacteria bacterium]
MVTNWEDQVDGLVDDIETVRKHTTHRRIIAVAGPPASGKTTLAQILADRLTNCSYLSLDGFYLDNSILTEKGLRDRKGSPETFDVNG